MRRFLILSFSLAFLATAALCGYWLWTAKLLQAGLDDWKSDREREGYVISHGERELTGFPFEVSLALPSAAVQLPRGWHWRGAQFQILSQLINPAQLTLTLTGAQEVLLSSPLSGGKSRIKARDTKLEIVVASDGQSPSGKGAFHNLSEQGPGGETLRGRELQFAFARHMNSNPGQASTRTDLRLQANDFIFPQLRLPLLGKTLTRLSLAGEIRGPLPQDFTPNELANWHKAGGLFHIGRLDIDWQPLGLSGQGQLGIDAQYRLTGELDIWWRGLAALIDTAAREGLLQANAVTGLKLALLALPSRRTADGSLERQLPLVFKSGGVFLGPVRIAQMGPLL